MTTIKTERILANPAIGIDHAGEGELLVLMHGIGGNRTNWTEQVEAFSEHFHTVSWDARGYGDSDDYEGPLDFGDFARDLKSLLDHFGAEKAHLCGLSMGGRIAQDFYLQFPERVKSLTLVATFAGFRSFSSQERQRFIDLRKKPLVEEGKEPKDIAPIVAKTLIGPAASDDTYQRLVHSMEMLHKESYVKTIEASTMYDKALELETVTVPTCLVFGEHDSLTTPETGKAMAERIKGSELHIVPRSGHLINIEEPEIFNRIVLGFLQRHNA
ncbi:MAG: alpha/beta fold hydrolase [Hyphomicrobiaceae bacterium]